MKLRAPHAMLRSMRAHPGMPIYRNRCVCHWSVAAFWNLEATWKGTGVVECRLGTVPRVLFEQLLLAQSSRTNNMYPGQGGFAAEPHSAIAI